MSAAVSQNKNKLWMYHVTSGGAPRLALRAGNSPGEKAKILRVASMRCSILQTVHHRSCWCLGARKNFNFWPIWTFEVSNPHIFLWAFRWDHLYLPKTNLKKKKVWTCNSTGLRLCNQSDKQTKPDPLLAMWRPAEPWFADPTKKHGLRAITRVSE